MQTSHQANPNASPARESGTLGRTRRFASRDVGDRYPLPNLGALDWSTSGSRHRVAIPVEELPAGHILVPSFSLIGAGAYAFQFSLAHADHRWTLASIGGDARVTPAPGPSVSTHVDYFRAERPATDLVLELVVESARVPERYLMTVASRAAHLEPTPGVGTSRRLTVSPLSQMTAPRSIRHHLCSPTSLTMVLRHHGVATDLGWISRACYHAESRMFGVWPSAILAASRLGAPGAIELFDAVDPAAPLIDQGLPVVASIRFGPGELRGSPQLRTGGHLVVITGLAEAQIYANDPAAGDPRAVCASYAREEFSRAWLTHRGAGYVVLPP